MTKARGIGPGPARTSKPPKTLPPHIGEMMRALPADSPVRKIVEDLIKNGVIPSEQDCELIKKIALSGIDLSDPKNAYHLDMLRALFQKEKMIYDVAAQLGIDFTGVRKIKVQVFKVADISMDIGTRRDVDLVTLETDRGEINFTISLDKEPYRHVGESHSRQEANILMSSNTSPGRWATQRGLGFTSVEINGRQHGTSAKEFLPGVMLTGFTEMVGTSEEQMLAPDLRVIAFNHGRMVGNILQTTGGFPRDMTPENVIVNDENGVTCRTCDLNGVDPSGNSWLKSLETDMKMWEKFAWHYLFGITAELSAAKRDSLLALMKSRFDLGMIDSLIAANQQLEAAEQMGDLPGEIERILEAH